METREITDFLAIYLEAFDNIIWQKWLENYPIIFIQLEQSCKVFIFKLDFTNAESSLTIQYFYIM
jgi:hypothetical protein